MKIHDINQKKNSNIKNQIEKIKIMRENNRNLPLKRKRKLNENYNDINEKKYESNLEKTKLLKSEIMLLQNEEEECLAKLKMTKERLNTFGSAENIYYGNIKKHKKNSRIQSIKSFDANV